MNGSARKVLTGMWVAKILTRMSATPSTRLCRCAVDLYSRIAIRTVAVRTVAIIGIVRRSVSVSVTVRRIVGSGGNVIEGRPDDVLSVRRRRPGGGDGNKQHSTDGQQLCSNHGNALDGKRGELIVSGSIEPISLAGPVKKNVDERKMASTRSVSNSPGLRQSPVVVAGDFQTH